VEPYIGGPLCYSPDIIIRKTAVANPQAAFANMAVDPGSDNVEIGNDNYIYIRVHNKGTINSDIHVRVYFAPLTTTCAPDQWESLGQIDFYNVPAGGDAVSNALVWENVPDPGSVGHFCIIASIEGFGDPHPDPAGISNASQYMDFIRNHNNICYRNVMFEDVLANTSFPINFIVAGFVGDMNKFDLRIDKYGLAVRAKVDLRLHQGMFRVHRVHLDNVIEQEGEVVMKGFRLFELGQEKRSAIKGLAVRPGSRNFARLEVQIPRNARPGEVYRLNVQHVYEGEVIGDFQVMGKVLNPRAVKYIGLRSNHLVHKANCRSLLRADKQSRKPFQSLADARSAGYDLALDCLNQPFKAKDISYRLARRVLNHINGIEIDDDLKRFVKDSLSIGYFRKRYGKEAKEKGYGIGIKTARQVLEARDRLGGFTRLEELEAVKGVGLDEFIDIVNSFK
jgi:hypothetical protein